MIFETESDLVDILRSQLLQLTESKAVEVFETWMDKLDAVIAGKGEYVF